MSTCILQLNFKLTVPPTEYERVVAPIAEAFATVPGLIWKIWLLDSERGEAGGIYLFRDPESRSAFLEGDLAANVAAAPFLSELDVKPFDAIEDLSRITRAPIGIAAGATA